MKTYKEFIKYNGYIITEEIHKELQDILDSDDSNDRGELYGHGSRKMNRFVKQVCKLIKNGESTGLESDKPKKRII